MLVDEWKDVCEYVDDDDILFVCIVFVVGSVGCGCGYVGFLGVGGGKVWYWFGGLGVVVVWKCVGDMIDMIGE